MGGGPYKQIARRRRVTLPEAAAMLETKRFAGRPIHGRIETWAQFMGPALAWLRGKLMYCRAPQPIGLWGTRCTQPGEIRPDTRRAVKPQRQQIEIGRAS